MPPFCLYYSLYIPKSKHDFSEARFPDEYAKAEARCKVYSRAPILRKSEYWEWREKEEAEYGDDLKAIKRPLTASLREPFINFRNALYTRRLKVCRH